MTVDEKRREQAKAHNQRLLEEISMGYSGAPVAMQDYFFPPRPIIKKDKNALEFLHKKPVVQVVED